MRILGQVLRSLYCSARKPCFGHFGHIQRQALVGLLRLDPTSSPSHSSSHLENLQVISCCLPQWDSATTATIHTSIDSTEVIDVCLVHSRGPLWRNWYIKIAELTTSRCLILWTVRTNFLVKHGGFPLRAAIQWLCSSQRIPSEL